jgi:outer membrane protein OmpA-like peptidoglycan-associated protein
MSRAVLFAICTCALALGCSSPGSQLATCQADKDQLLATIRSQRDANRQLQDQLASLEGRLDESEKELARRVTPGTRLSSRPVEDSNLAWRGGERKSEVEGRKSKVESRMSNVGDLRPQASDRGPLAALAARDRRLTLDAASGTANLDTNVSFEEGTANLTAEARRQLDEVARLLKTKEAEQLRVLVSGYAEGRPPKSGENAFTSARQLGAARAQAVADYLDRHGIAEERLGVSGVGTRPAASSTALAPASSVQIILAEPDVPILGWGGPAAGQTKWR